MELNLKDIKDSLNNLRQDYNQGIGVVKSLEEEKKNKEKELESLNFDKDKIGVKKALLQDACKKARSNSKDVLQSVATTGLQAVMGDHMHLNIVLNEDSTPATVEFKTVSEYDGYIVDDIDPTDSDGGGVADVIAMSCFMSMNHLVAEKNSAPILLDEPTKYVSAGHSEDAAKFIYEISKFFKKQIFMVTHDIYLTNVGDKGFRLELDRKGRTKFIST